MRRANVGIWERIPLLSEAIGGLRAKPLAVGGKLVLGDFTNVPKKA